MPGRYNSFESKEAYKNFVREVIFGKQEPYQPLPGTRPSIASLVAAYLDHAENYYPTGERSEYDHLKRACGHLLAHHSKEPAESFGPLKLQALRDLLAKPTEAGKQRTRTYINSVVRRIQRCFRWGVSQEIIPASVYESLRTVGGLKRNRSQAREPVKRRPVAWEHVEAILLHVSPMLADMIQLQWHTGCRSDSLCNAQPAEFDRSGEIWLWRPKHKTEWMEKELVIVVGPQAQAILKPYLDRPANAFLFSPNEVSGRKDRRHGKRYTSHSYQTAITRGIERLNCKRVESEEPKIPKWTPHQMRHSKGHSTRERYGVEAQQAVLGHESIQAAQLYSDRRLELAKTVARETG